MAGEIEQLLNIRTWCSALTINEQAYRESTLEVLTTFNIHQDYDVWDEPNTIHFLLLGHEYHLSYTEFIIYLGLYDHDYITTNDYWHLHSFPRLGEHDSQRW